MLYLIDIHWTRRTPEEGRSDKGISTIASAARTFTAARTKATKQFRRHYGTYLAVTQIVEKQDPAGIFQ